VPSIDLSTYYQPPGTTSDGTKFDNALALIQATMNAIDQNNFASGKIFDPTKIQQGGASTSQALIWDGSNWAPKNPPGFEVGYQVFTTDQATTSTSLVDLFTFSAATFENVKHYLEITIPNLRHTVANASVVFQLMEGASTVGNQVQFEASSTVGNGVSVCARVPFVPTAASHTYKVQWKTATAGTATVKATGAGDAVFRLVKA